MPPDADHGSAVSHVLDLAHATRTYKVLLSGGHYNTSTQELDIPDPTLSATFAIAFWKAITSEDAGGEDNAVRVAKGNAPFVVVELVEALVVAGRGAEVKRVLGQDGIIAASKSSGRKGAALLAEKLAAL